ncbi:MAG: hypothetical protein JW939_09175 [Candidatus Thermoplasmatota archaeon]|nr:hypothetical protein [Candidatus Thermoplasmatota archaeon]
MENGINKHGIRNYTRLEWVTRRNASVYYRQLFEYNSRLVDEVLRRKPISTCKRVVEFGSGSGLFTIPLMDKLHEDVEEYIIVDPYEGPYIKDRESLARRIRESGYSGKARILKVPVWGMRGKVEDVDLVIGHDVFCDLTMYQVKNAMMAGKDVLREGGFFIHSGLSPNASTAAERLLMKLDSHTSTPLVENNWFSPGSEFLFVISREAGFGDITIHEVKIPLLLSGNDAMSILKEWNIEDKVLKKYQKQIDEIGIEFPGEQILICRK